MLTPHQAAKLILEKAKASELSLSNLKLQKLLYLAQGVHLARHSVQLITKPFQAWRFGPVNEDLYHELKYFGSDAIDPNHPIVNFEKNVSATAEENQSIEDVVKAFGNLTAQRLVGITHASDGPWAEVYQHGTKQIEISDEKIKSYFFSKLKKVA
jgi:uncharacterized phage-associated protein